jgi:hypothetical protein
MPFVDITAEFPVLTETDDSVLTEIGDIISIDTVYGDGFEVAPAVPFTSITGADAFSLLTETYISIYTETGVSMYLDKACEAGYEPPVSIDDEFAVLIITDTRIYFATDTGSEMSATGIQYSNLGV